MDDFRSEDEKYEKAKRQYHETLTARHKALLKKLLCSDSADAAANDDMKNEIVALEKKMERVQQELQENATYDGAAIRAEEMRKAIFQQQKLPLDETPRPIKSKEMDLTQDETPERGRSASISASRTNVSLPSVIQQTEAPPSTAVQPPAVQPTVVPPTGVESPWVQQPSFQQPSFQQPSFQQPSFQQPSFQQGPFHHASSPDTMGLTKDTPSKRRRRESPDSSDPEWKPKTSRPLGTRPRRPPQKFSDQEQATTGTSKSRADDGKYSEFGTIAESHGCLVPTLDGLPGALELACPVCECNAKSPDNNVDGKPKFFSGYAGVRRHVQRVHPDSEYAKKKMSRAEAIEAFTVAFVIPAAVDEIKAGAPNACMPQPRQVPRHQPVPPLQAAGSAGNASTTNNQGMAVPTFQAAGSAGNASTTNNQ
ncbi:hypothetical protein KC324_g14385, partial [Hortaea werneckii]